MRNLISTAECQQIIQLSTSDDGVKVIDYNFHKYCEGYPGFLGEYWRLQICYLNVSVSSFFIDTIKCKCKLMVNNSYCFRLTMLSTNRISSPKLCQARTLKSVKCSKMPEYSRKRRSFMASFYLSWLNIQVIWYTLSQQNQYFPFALITSSYCRLQVHQNGHRPVIFHVKICLLWKT